MKTHSDCQPAPNAMAAEQRLCTCRPAKDAADPTYETQRPPENVYRGEG